MGNSSGHKRIIIVQGGQWGSEAKGLITHKLTLEKKVDVAIRTGTVNAGHTVYHKGKAYAMQQLPVSWVKPNCMLVLGPGAYICPEILARELEWISIALGQDVEEVLNRVYIDHRCGLHLPDHTLAAKKADRHHSIGTTGKGCSEAVVGKIQRRDNLVPPLFSSWIFDKGGIWKQIGRRIVDTVHMVNTAYDTGHQLLIEGTQGTLLDLHLGPYPYTTHKQTQASSWMAEAGLSCTLPTDLWTVFRTYPIRVAGNSGPMPGEMSWLKMARDINHKMGRDLVAEWALQDWLDAMVLARQEWPDCPSTDPAYWTQSQRVEFRVAASEIHRVAFDSLPENAKHELKGLFEFTTVTRKLRRIAEWDWATFDRSMMLNRPTNIALTFMNYRYPTLWGAGLFAVTQDRHWMYDQWFQTIWPGRDVGIVSFGPQIEHTHMMRDL